MNCGNAISTWNKPCNKCGNMPYNYYNYCYNCGRQNAENYAICNGCKTPLVAKQNKIIFTLLSFFMFAPFHRFYAGHKKSGYITILIWILFVVFFTIGGTTQNIFFMFLSAMCPLILFIWWCIDFSKIFFRFPSDYLNSDGLPLD